MSSIISEHGVTKKDEEEFNERMASRGWRVVETDGIGRVVLRGKTSVHFQDKAKHHMAQIQHKRDVRKSLKAKLLARREVAKIECDSHALEGSD